MITQAIKRWLQKLSAWWPWKQSTHVEYQHVASSMTRPSASEANFWPYRGEGTAPQAGVTPRLSTLEDHPEWVGLPRHEVFNLSLQPTPITALNPDAEAIGEHETPHHGPTDRQRLDFLRYLVERGIVNEGFEPLPPDNQS